VWHPTIGVKFQRSETVKDTNLSVPGRFALSKVEGGRGDD